MIQFYNRYTQCLEEELGPNEHFLSWLYKSTLGRFLLKLVFRNPWASKWIGSYLNTRFSKRHIKAFAEKHAIDLNLLEKNIDQYIHFNDFFYRKFKQGVRPINPDPHTLCFPADGRHLGFETVSDLNKFYIKGDVFDLATLLGSDKLAQQFQDASVVISRLCIADCHHFFFPIDGIPSESNLINGYLYSVHPTALQQNFKIFLENKRWVCILKHPRLGDIALIEVGATNVGSVQQTYKPRQAVKKGHEKGYFLLGSTVITLFEANKVCLSEDLLEQTQRGYELYAHYGDVMGTLRS